MADAALTTAEVESIRTHLGYGNISVGAYPYTPDGFLEEFTQVVAPNLGTGPETSAATSIKAGADAVVTPASMAGIVVHARLVVDVGDQAEVVVVRAVSDATFTARFANAHPSTGYPIAVESGTTRVRQLLQSLDKAWTRLQSQAITRVAGLKMVGRGQAEWFPGNRVLADVEEHYMRLACALADIVRVRPRWETDGHAGGTSQLESY